MNSLVLDICILAIFVIFVVMGFRSGVMRSFVMFVGAIFASVFSGYCSSKVADFVFTTFVSPSIESSVLKSISESTLSFQTFCGNLPGFLCDTLASYGITPSEFNHIISSSTESEIPMKVSKLVEPAFTGVFKYIFSIFIFIILMLVVRLSSRFVLKLFKHKPINKANSLVGGFFGALKAYVVVAVSLCCIRALVPMMQNPPEIFSNESISSSMVFKEFYFKNPIYDMFQKM